MITFVWIIDFRPFNNNRFEDKRQSLNGSIVERKVDESKSVFLIPEYWKSKKKAIDSTIFMILQRRWFFKDNGWLFKDRLKLKDNHPKIKGSLKDYDWFWMESWKLENSFEDNQTNLRKSTHRAHIHETLKKLAYSRIYPYTHALFFSSFIVNTKYLQLVWGQPWHDSAKPGCPKPYIVRRNMLCACF